MQKELIIHTKMLKVISWLFQKVNTFPKKQRFILGQQIENSALTCLRLIVEANNLGQHHEALGRLNALNVELEVLRSLLRVGYDVQFLTAKSLAYIIAEIDEVGRMRGGWARRYKR